MDAPAPIDWDHLARFTGGDPGIEGEVLDLFCEQIEIWLRALTPDADAETWRSAAHTLKGASKGVGAFAMGAACADAEALPEDAGPAVRSAAAEAVRAAAFAAAEAVGRRRQQAAVARQG